MPKTRFEYDKAKMSMVRMRATDVRGMTLDGRCVSSAACEMLSSPTNETIAKETPLSRSFAAGQCACIVCTSIWGCHANRNAQARMNVSVQTSIPATISLMREDWRTPITLIYVRKPATANTQTKYQGWLPGCASHGMSVGELT